MELTQVGAWGLQLFCLKTKPSM